MQFNTGYHPMNDMYGPMDRGFSESDQIAVADPLGLNAAKDDIGVGVADIGMSVPMGIAAPNVQGVQSKIRAGVNSIEIGFPGAIQGNRQGHTPGMYGKDQRQALKEVMMANQVKFTTHAAYQIMGLTGGIEQGSDLIKFDMNRAKLGQQEIERAIDFASDVPGGGSVVIHTGEFLRPLTDMYLPEDHNNLSRADDGRLMFKQRLTEEKDAKFYLIDDRTGQAMGQVEKDRLVAFPDWNRYESKNSEFWDKQGGRTYRDENGNTVRPGDYIDYRGNLIEDPFDPAKGRVPIYDRDTGRFKIRYMSYDDFKKEADEKNYFHKKKFGSEPDYYEKTTQTEAYLQATLETQEGHSRGWALQYGERVDAHISNINGLKKAKDFYMRIDKSIPESEKWKIMMQDQQAARYGLGQFIPGENKSPVEIIDNLIKEQEKSLEFARQASASQEQQAYDTAENKRHIVEPIKYVERFTIRGYAEAGLHALQRSNDPNNPIVLTLEHIFPERFGGHPEEHIWIVEKARERMADLLTKPEIELGVGSADESVFERDEQGLLSLKKQPNPFYKPGVSRQEAEKLAEQHIKITIDTGHLNLWRKHFQPKPGASPEQNEAEFRNWYLEQVEKMASKGMVGNLHLVDNWGYQDEHLSPGQGNAPIKETLKILKKYGYDGAYTVEPGADASTDLSDFHGLMKSWRYFGSNIYGMSGTPAAGGQRWGNVQNSYFGQNQPPYFVFGAYSPSQDWVLWSQTPLE